MGIDLFYVLVAAAAFCLVIIVHELGHFAVAKLTGIRVETFSVGFGPRLASFERGGTRYQIAPILVGGYVKLAGESEEGRQHKPDEMLSKPWYVRAALAFAGPAMNFVFPVLFLFVLYSTAGKPFNFGPAMVDSVRPGWPAQVSGVQVDDRIVKVDGQAVPNFEDLPKMTDSLARSHPGAPLKLGILRKGREITVEVLPRLDQDSGRYRLGLNFVPGPPSTRRIVQQVLVGTPAEKAGFRAGDEILSVEGKTLPDGLAFVPAFAASAADPVPVTLKRQDQVLTLDVPKKQPVPEGMGRSGEFGLLGLELQVESSLTYRKMGVAAAARTSVMENLLLGRLMIEGIASLVRGKVGFRESVGGPITMIRMAHQQAQSGMIHLINFMASISIMLCIMNFLPLPVLDGGVIFFCLVEGLRGKPLSDRAQVALQNVGIALLVSLMLFATYNDILSWIQHAMRAVK